LDRTQLLSPRQVARAIGVSESSVKRWCDEGLIETTRTEGGHRRLSLESVQDYLGQEGHQAEGAALLAVPSTIGVTVRIRRRAVVPLREALQRGDMPVAAHLVDEVLQAGHTLSRVLDDVLLAALRSESEESQDVALPQREFLERRARQTALGVLDRLRASRPKRRAGAKLALVAALDGARDGLWIEGAALTLAEAGWEARVLGTLLPFRTLDQALGAHRPGLLCLHVPEVRDPRRFAREWTKLLRTAQRCETRLRIGGETPVAGLPEGLAAQFCVVFDKLRTSCRR
jgi:excisionase family DNA binding protein